MIDDTGEIFFGEAGNFFFGERVEKDKTLKEKFPPPRTPPPSKEIFLLFPLKLFRSQSSLPLAKREIRRKRRKILLKNEKIFSRKESRTYGKKRVGE